jgi:outer membrane beta-barrel protein
MLFRVVLLLVISFSTAAHSAEPADTSQDEYDFSWLDPDKKIYVVQNRKYTKKNRLELAFSGGFGIGEAYRSRTTMIPRGFFYLNESWGVSAFAGFNSNSENQDFIALKSVSSVVPAVRDIQNFYGASVVWVPFYGKVNMFNQIFYLDWHLEAGAGQVNSEIDLNIRSSGSPQIDESAHTSFHWGTGQKFFITRNFAARLDFLALYYTAPTGIDGSLTSTKGSATDTYDNYFVTVGLSYTF